MELVYSKHAGMRLDEPENFKAFKFVLEGFELGEQPAIADLDYDSNDHVWIPPSQVLQFATSDAWRLQFHKMIEGAAKYGWIHPDTQAIKAHIQWQSASKLPELNQVPEQSLVVVRQEHGYTVITLNRPEKLNALTRPMLQALKEAVFAATQDHACRAILITGHGRGFCTGQDLNERRGLEQAVDLGESLIQFYNPIIAAIDQAKKPVVCAVNGVAAGAGVGLALACDIVLAADDARFIQSFSKIGLAPDAGISWHLPRLIGSARAKALTILAEPISAVQAQEWGMIWATLPSEKLHSEAEALVKQLSQRPTLSFAAIKQAHRSTAINTLQQQLDLEATLQQKAGWSEDYKRGVQAFFDGTTAQFTGQ